MLKAAAPVIAATLAHILTKILEEGRYPEEWAEALVVPLYKGKGNLHDPNNYRGISLLSHIAKILTHILNVRITQWLEERGIISKAQAGFRKGYSTIDNAYILDTIITQRFRERKKKLYTCYFDFQKAFDSIPRAAIWFKLHSVGIKGKCFNLLRNMYTKCSFRVMTSSSEATDVHHSSSGVFQGCILSATLFQIFVNDIIDYIATSTEGTIDAPILGGTPIPSLLFADDLLVMSTTVQGLQRIINRVGQYAEYWGLRVNIQKTKCMVFRRGGKLAAAEKWHYQQQNIEIVNTFRYLGIWFSTKRVWSHHMNTTASQAKRVIYLMRRLSYGIGKLPLKLQWHLFDMMVAPIVLYGAEIWGGKANNVTLDKVETKYAKQIVKVPQCAPSSALMLELNRNYTIFWKARLSIVRYWLRLLRMPDTKLAKQAYYVQRQMAYENIDCWASAVREILVEAGKESVWENGVIGLGSPRVLRDQL